MATKIFDTPIPVLNAQGRLRHRNGNGNLYDQAESDPLSFIDKYSAIRELAEIRESKITASQVQGATIVHRATIQNSYVDCDFVLGGQILDSWITGRSKIWGNPTIDDVSVSSLCVFGDAKLVGPWSLDGRFGRIGTGLWIRPPRVVRYEDLNITITEGVNDTAYVGCRLHSVSQWLRIGDRIGRAAGWRQWQVDRLRELFLFWRDRPL